MKNKSIFEGIGIFVSAIILVAIALFLQPVIYVGFGYLGGLVVKWIFGGMIVEGMNGVFGTDRFTPGMIPVVAATLAFIGSYFKSSNTNNNKK
ncbi:MAG: hypothetical protein ACQEXX_01225 [Bacillota bacterium]